MWGVSDYGRSLFFFLFIIIRSTSSRRVFAPSASKAPRASRLACVRRRRTGVGRTSLWSITRTHLPCQNEGEGEERRFFPRICLIRCHLRFFDSSFSRFEIWLFFLSHLCFPDPFHAYAYVTICSGNFKTYKPIMLIHSTKLNFDS